MINLLNFKYFLTSGVISIIFELTMLIFLITNWRVFLTSKNLVKYEAIQKIHEVETPRLGGLVIYLTLFLYFTLNFFLVGKGQHNYKAIFLLTSFIPIFFFSLKEDIYQNVKPIIRLVTMVMSSILVLFFLADSIKSILDVYFFPKFFPKYFIYFIFFLFNLALINGSNFIDGCNGLSTFSSLIILLILLMFSINYQNFFLLKIYIPFIFIIGIFLIFNYPFGKIFLGDLGAYLLGFIVSTCLILFFSEIKSFSPFIILNLCFYPLFEVFFSFLRKVIQKKSPFDPDMYHLHLLAFRFFQKMNFSNSVSNNLIIIFLLPIIIFPLVIYKFAAIFSLKDLFLMFLLQVLIYLLLYFFLLFLNRSRVK